MKFFISYSSRDAAVVREYRDLLISRRHETWMAPESIPLGESYAEAIPAGIAWCDYFLVFISAHSLSSRWVRSEIDSARQKNKRIVPVYLEDIELTESFRFYLNDCQGIVWNAFSADPALNLEKNILPFMEQPSAGMDPAVMLYNEKLSRKIVNFNKVFTSLDLKVESGINEDASLDLMLDIYAEDVDVEFDLAALVSGNGRYFIHGEAGAGKTTILKKIVLDIANYCLKNGVSAIPVFVELSRVPAPEALFPEIVKTIHPDEKAVQAILRNAHLIIALDGLDEFSMENRENRERLMNAIDEIHARYQCSVMIGCRTNSLPRNTDYKLVKINPLTDRQIMEFIHKYFAYFAISIDENTFFRWLKEIAKGVSVTPLLLSIAIGLNKGSTTLTRTIDDLYKTYIKRLLAKIRVRMTPGEVDEYFYFASRIAFEMLIRSKSTILIDELNAEFLSSEWHETNPQEMTGNIVSSELMSRNDRFLSFIHASVMEYLGQVYATREFDFVPKESMDQYFLKDVKIISVINHVLNISPSDTVMELGAGIGSVASRFPECRKLYLVDLDDGLCRILRYNFRRHPWAEVMKEDALAALQHVRCNKIVSNLPFFLTHDILTALKKVSFDVAVMSVRSDDRFDEFRDSLYIQDLTVIPGSSFYPLQPFDSRLIMVKKKESGGNGGASPFLPYFLEEFGSLRADRPEDMKGQDPENIR